MTVGTLVGWKSGAVMFLMSGMSGAGLGQQGSGQDIGNVNPMSPTRAETGCVAVPVPPSTSSTGSRQQQGKHWDCWCSCYYILPAEAPLSLVLDYLHASDHRKKKKISEPSRTRMTMHIKAFRWLALNSICLFLRLCKVKQYQISKLHSFQWLY